MEKHISVVAALRVGMSVLLIFLAVLLFFVMHFVGRLSGDPELQGILSIIAMVLGAFLLIVSIPGVIAGIGLFNRKEWARILTLVLSVFDLIRFPVGTAIGVYSIWALVQPEVVEQFKIN